MRTTRCGSGSGWWGSELEEQLRYWKERLAGAAAALELPADRVRPAVPSYRGARQTFTLGGSVAGVAGAWTARGCHAVHGVAGSIPGAAGEVERAEDIVVGSPIAGRTDRQLEALIGFFVNTLVMRTDVSGNPTFRGLLEQVKQGTVEAYAHQDLPFAKLVAELDMNRDMSRHPLFQVMFTVQNHPVAASIWSGVAATS